MNNFEFWWQRPIRLCLLSVIQNALNSWTYVWVSIVRINVSVVTLPYVCLATGKTLVTETGSRSVTSHWIMYGQWTIKIEEDLYRLLRLSFVLVQLLYVTSKTNAIQTTCWVKEPSLWARKMSSKKGSKHSKKKLNVERDPLASLVVYQKLGKGTYICWLSFFVTISQNIWYENINRWKAKQ